MIGTARIEVVKEIILENIKIRAIRNIQEILNQVFNFTNNISKINSFATNKTIKINTFTSKNVSQKARNSNSTQEIIDERSDCRSNRFDDVTDNIIDEII